MLVLTGEASVGIVGVYWITKSGARSFSHNPGRQPISQSGKLCDELLTDRIFDGFKMIGEMREPNGEVFGRLYRVESVPND